MPAPESVPDPPVILKFPSVSYAEGQVTDEPVGAERSTVTVKSSVSVSPALLYPVTVLAPGEVVAVAPIAYALEYGEDRSSVSVVGVKPVVFIPGKVTFSMPDCASDAEALTVKF